MEQKELTVQELKIALMKGEKWARKVLWYLCEWDKAKQKDTTEQDTICQILEQIRNDYESGIDLSYDDIVFLQEHQDTIKEVYWDSPTMWELAGIPEEEWANNTKWNNHIESLQTKDN